MQSESAITCKIVLLGESGVGKSSLASSFLTGTFSSDPEPTIGASFTSKLMTVGDQLMKLHLWDTAGQERYRSLSRMYYHDAQVAILVYDITAENTYKALQGWFITVIAVVGNKQDLEEQETVNPEEAKKWCEGFGGLFAKTSAKNMVGVQELFLHIGERILFIERMAKRTTFRLSESQVDSGKKGCC